jgi:hypothetical protein
MELTKINSLPVVVGANTKTEIESLANAIVSDILEKGNPLELAEMLSSTEYLVKTIKADSMFADYVKDELVKNNGKLTTSSGTKIEACETGTKYHFDKCNDPVLAALYEQQIRIKAEIDARESFLKAVPSSGMEIRHEDELITVSRPYKTSTSSYKITLAK